MTDDERVLRANTQRMLNLRDRLGISLTDAKTILDNPKALMDALMEARAISQVEEMWNADGTETFTYYELKNPKPPPMTDDERMLKLSGHIKELWFQIPTRAETSIVIARAIIANPRAHMDVLVEAGVVEHDGDWPESGTFYRLPRRRPDDE
jgi:hypothetical protein